MLIGLTGRGLNENGDFVSTARVGKDFVGNIFKEEFNAMQISFALPIKRIAQLILGLNHDEGWNDDKTFKETPMTDYGFSPRRAQQIIGTEVGRMQMDQNLWINIVDLTCSQLEAQRFTLNSLLGSETLSERPDSFEDLILKSISILFNIPLEQVIGYYNKNEPLPIGDLFECTNIHDIITAFKNGMVMLVREVHNDVTMNDEEAFALFWKHRIQRPFYQTVYSGPYEMTGKEKHVVVMDIRFDNEADYAREKGKLVHIERILHGMPKVTGHLSERGIDLKLNDFLLHNNKDKQHVINQFSQFIGQNNQNISFD